MTKGNEFHPTIIGRLLERMRKDLGITIANLARENHIGNSTYEDIKKGAMRN